MGARQDSLFAAEDSRYPISLKRFLSFLGGRRHGVRLRTRLIWILLFSSVLSAGGIQFGVPNVGLLEWAISASAVSILVCLAFREVSRRIKGNVFSEPPGRASTYLWLVLVVVAYVSWPLVEEHLVRNRSLIQLLTITLTASFFLSAVVTLGWLMIYERRNGPVYVVNA